MNYSLEAKSWMKAAKWKHRQPHNRLDEWQLTFDYFNIINKLLTGRKKMNEDGKMETSPAYKWQLTFDNFNIIVWTVSKTAAASIPLPGIH